MEHIKTPAELLEKLTILSTEGNDGCPHGCIDGLLFKITERHPMGVSTDCQCRKDAIERKRFENLLKVSDVYNDRLLTFEVYNPQNEKQREALAVMSKRHGSYYLYGPWGTGKTHLMTASVIRAVENGIQSVRIVVPRLLDLIRRTGQDQTHSIEELAREIPYLALDDIGKEKPTPWVQERMFMLIDNRCTNQRAGKCHTSFTSQIPLRLLADRLDGAIVSRIKGMCEELFVDGPDYREKQQ